MKPSLSGQICTETRECGDNPKGEEMTGEDVEVICGEWEIGDATMASSAEKYNTIFSIEEIKRHPEFGISRGNNKTQFVINDIATIHVTPVDRSIFDENKIYPGCLPRSRLSKQSAIHAGWSTPPPPSYLQDNAPYHVPYYRDFRKMWHYRIDIAACQDPITNEISDEPLEYPSDTYYPPGLICGKEQRRYFCPSSGESGSPLMTDNDGKGKLQIDGILSFIKGCGAFSFDQSFGSLYPVLSLFDPDDFNLTYSVLYQLSNNPSAYTKLSCFLPWIAEQYGLEYSDPVPDQACVEGNGNIEDVTEAESRECRSSPSSYFDVYSSEYQLSFTSRIPELPCIFPFYLDGQRNEGSCIQLGG